MYQGDHLKEHVPGFPVAGLLAVGPGVCGDSKTEVIQSNIVIGKIGSWPYLALFERRSISGLFEILWIRETELLSNAHQRPLD